MYVYDYYQTFDVLYCIFCLFLCYQFVNLLLWINSTGLQNVLIFGNIIYYLVISNNSLVHSKNIFATCESLVVFYL